MAEKKKSSKNLKSPIEYFAKYRSDSKCGVTTEGFKKNHLKGLEAVSGIHTKPGIAHVSTSQIGKFQHSHSI